MHNQNPTTRVAPPLVIAVLYQGMNLFELGVVAEVFGSDRPDFVAPLFRLKFAQAEAGVLKGGGGVELRAHGNLSLLKEADIVLIPGWRGPGAAAPSPLLKAILDAHARGAKIVSICAGAFILAEAGLLDGKRATTHWRYAQAFQERFPNVALDSNVLYVDEGSVMTSAGSAAGIDASLHLVRKEYGSEVANTVARAMVTNSHRNGGQPQYISRPMPIRSDRSLAQLLDWVRARIGAPISVSQLASQACVSERTLLRRFETEMGTTPKRWIQNERICAAQSLLESTELSLQDIADAVGFTTLPAFRAAFRQSVSIAPALYRQRFRQ